MKRILSAFFMLFFLQTIVAQFPDDMPYQSIQTPADVAFPDYLETVIDNSVSNPIEITRITEPYYYNDAEGNPQVWYPTHEYAKTQVWNADQSMFKVVSWKIIDATNYQDIQTLSDMYPSYWSNSNPDLIWSFRENGDIKKHTISTNVTETIASLAGYEYVKLGPGEGNIDKNDHYVALVGKKANGDLDIIVYDLQTLQIVTIKTFEGAWDDGEASFPKYIDWVSISQSGNYVVIMWNHNTATDDDPNNQYIENGNLHYGVEVFNTIDMEYQSRISRYGNHGDLGYAVDGSEVLVQAYGEYGGGNLYMHKLDGSASDIVLTTNEDFDTNYGGESHVSCRNINRPGWAYVTLSYPNQSGQIVAVKLDETGTFEHFGHHFSSNTSYDQSPMAVASPDGKKICFKSDFGTGPNTNPSVAYIFISEVASQLNVADNKISDISLYPNPVKSELNIQSKTVISQIAIYSIYGQLIKTKKPNSSSLKINIENFTKGIYLVSLTDIKGNVSNRKIMVK